MKQEKNVRGYTLCWFSNSRKYMGAKKKWCFRIQNRYSRYGDWFLENNPNFECLRDICEVVYLPRTEEISTTKIKNDLGLQEADNNINKIPMPKGEK